ncbi:hypothetical protein LCGC14_1589210 [marine sediment metagenome]|uniref:Uncharacterized protein n=1 Tax=marine sediment metagenome TaxID=412755 RepID=A0A0F9IEJ8_9ZZZZ
MADKKLSELDELAVSPADDDEVYIRDVSEGASAESKRITVGNLVGLIKDLFGAHTVLIAISNNTPVALVVGQQTVVGRLTGENITAVAIGISDNNIVQIDHASATDDDYAKFTAAGLEGRSFAEVLADLSGQATAAFSWNGQNLTETGTINASNAVWWREHHYTIFSISPGASGATETAPDSNTLGGWQLNASAETLFYNCHVHEDWSEDSDLEAHVIFEVNVDNTGGNVGDTVDLQLIARMKGDAETAVKTQTLEIATVVGQSAQYKQFEAIFLVDFDSGTDPLDVGDLVTFELNLETDTSEVGDIIVNHVMCRYRSKKPQNEV